MLRFSFTNQLQFPTVGSTDRVNTSNTPLGQEAAVSCYSSRIGYWPVLLWRGLWLWGREPENNLLQRPSLTTAGQPAKNAGSGKQHKPLTAASCSEQGKSSVFSGSDGSSVVETWADPDTKPSPTALAQPTLNNNSFCQPSDEVNLKDFCESSQERMLSLGHFATMIVKKIFPEEEREGKKLHWLPWESIAWSREAGACSDISFSLLQHSRHSRLRAEQILENLHFQNGGDAQKEVTKQRELKHLNFSSLGLFRYHVVSKISWSNKWFFKDENVCDTYI